MLYAQSNRRILAMFDAQMYLRDSDCKDAIRGQIGEAYDVFKRIIRDYILNGQRDGSVKSEDPDCDAEAVSALIRGLFYQLAYMENLGLRSKETIQTILRETLNHTLHELSA